MSQDLLSFLDEPTPRDHPKVTPTFKNTSPSQTDPRSISSFQTVEKRDLDEIWKAEAAAHNNNQSVLDNANDEDDDFGDFEDASSAPPPVSSTIPANVPIESKPKDSPPKPKPPARMLPTRSPFPPKAAPKPTKSNFPISPKPPPDREVKGSHPFAGRMDLLFEADGDDYDAGADEMGDLANNPEAAMEYSKRIIAEQEEATKGKGKGKQPAGQRGGFVDLEEVKANRVGMDERMKGAGKARVKDPNVLFDADDVSDEGGGGGEDDDFGDFETWDVPAATAPTAQSRSQVEEMSLGMDLLGLDDEPKQATIPKTAQTRSDVSTTKAQQKNGSMEPSASSSALQQRDEGFWDDFDTASSASKSQKQPAPSQPQQDDAWSDFDTPPPSATSNKSKPTPRPPPSHQDITPPTNIPPPLTLLTLFPPIFSAADFALFSAMGKLDLKSRTMLLSHPASHQFLRGYLSQVTVLARIIAGRKLRWKRDQRLSQSMRIGPSVAGGGKGGMKLAGLDKSEVAKEEREVLDTVRLYRAQIGKLRSAVTAANAAPGLPKLPAVPEIGEVMPVRSLKQGEGGVTAREACVLCGLRREERVVRVDDGAEDSFGEWWVQGRGMHAGCWGFWEEQERKLKGR